MSVEINDSEAVDFDLGEVAATLRASAEYGSDGRSARTLAKTPEMSVVLTVIAAGAALREHRAPGSVALTVIDGKIAFRGADGERELASGSTVVFAGGMPHSVAGIEDAAFLLAITKPH